ncbi:MAG: chemotaxis protein CheW [Thermoanaerobaculia bacterium]
MTVGAYLLVRLGETVAALPAAAVRRVVRGARLHPLPGGGAGILGLEEFAGEPLAVLDLAHLLGGEARTSRPPVTVIAWLGSEPRRDLVGLGVDDAIEVADLETDDFLRGQAMRNGLPVVIVDTGRLGQNVGDAPAPAAAR